MTLKDRVYETIVAGTSIDVQIVNETGATMRYVNRLLYELRKTGKIKTVWQECESCGKRHKAHVPAK